MAQIFFDPFVEASVDTNLDSHNPNNGGGQGDNPGWGRQLSFLDRIRES